MQIFVIFTKNFNIMSLSKTILAALIVAATSTASYAQKCQFDVDKTDPISHMSFRSVKYDINPNGVFHYALLEQKGSKYYMTFEIAQPGKIDGKMVKGMEVLLHRQNDNVLLLADEDNNPIYTTDASGKTITTWKPRCEVTKSELTALSIEPVTAYHSNFAYRDMKQPAGSEAAKIQQAVKCMLK
jgi:hypothetical protein